MTGKHSNYRNNRDGIGTLNEHSLHADLIHFLAQPGDVLESELDGYRIDIHRGNRIIEVQTRNLKSLIRKINNLSNKYQIEIVYPIYKTKFIQRVDSDDQTISRRKSPKSGKLVDVFAELIYTPQLLTDPNVALKILLIEADEVWRDDGLGSWRRKYWSISDRKLIKVIHEHQFHQPDDLLELLPQTLPAPFTNQHLVEMLKISPRLAGKITYTLRKMDLVKITGKQGRAYLFDTF